MLKILYKRYYREVYILYLLICILCWFLLWYFWNNSQPFQLLAAVVISTSVCFIAFIPFFFFPDNKWRKSYGNKECKNKCIVVHRAWSVWETKCEHCEYCPHSVHKYQHKVFKRVRIFKNKFLGW